jgi:hypothetical protein
VQPTRTRARSSRVAKTIRRAPVAADVRRHDER